MSTEKTFKRRNGFKAFKLAFNKSKGICYLCKKVLPVKEINQYIFLRDNNKIAALDLRHKLKVNIDHIEPFGLFQNNYLENLNLVHVKCNTEKSSKDSHQIEKYFSRLSNL